MTCSGVFSTLYDELGILFSVWAPDGRSRLSVGNQDPAGRGTSRRPAVDGPPMPDCPGYSRPQRSDQRNQHERSLIRFATSVMPWVWLRRYLGIAMMIKGLIVGRAIGHTTVSAGLDSA